MWIYTSDNMFKDNVTNDSEELFQENSTYVLKNSTIVEMQNISNETVPQFLTNCMSAQCLVVASIVSAVTILGIVANSTVLLRVIWDRKLHTPTFVTLASLGLADLLFLIFKYISSVLMAYFPESFPPGFVQSYFALVLDSIGSVAGASSTVHILTLYVLRYISLIHPLQFYVYATVKHIVLTSLAIWLFCSTIWSFYVTIVILNYKLYPQLALVTNIFVTLLFSFVPFLIILIIHFIKTAKLKRSVAAVRFEATRTMSKMVVATVIMYLVTTTPANIRDILSLGFNIQVMKGYSIFSSICHVLVFINFAVNPFIYFIISKLFRSSVRHCFCNK